MINTAERATRALERIADALERLAAEHGAPVEDPGHWARTFTPPAPPEWAQEPGVRVPAR